MCIIAADIVRDTGNDIRRKIRAYLAEGNKVTHFLRDIGGVNSNSYQRFMAQTGPAGGCSNSTYVSGLSELRGRS